MRNLLKSRRQSQSQPWYLFKRKNTSLFISISAMVPIHLNRIGLFIKSYRSNFKLSLTSHISRVATTQIVPNKPKIDAEINRLCTQGRLKEALDTLKTTNTEVDTHTYVSLVKVCTDKRALQEGKQLHTHVFSTGLEPDIFLSTKLVNMYVTCNSLVDARLLFDRIPNRNVFCWNAILRGYTKNSMFEETLRLYHQMLHDGIKPDRFTFPYVLKACGGMSALKEGLEVHDLVVSCGLESEIVVGSALIDMYANCGCLEDARNVFDKMPERDIVSWSAMIGASVQNGQCDEALKLFRDMVLSGVKPDPVTIATVLPACARLAALYQGMEIQEYAIRNGLQDDISVQNALMDIYSKCGSTEDAHQVVFGNILERDMVFWNSMIAGYSQNGHCDETLELFQQMKLAGVKPSSVTFASVLSACAQLACVKHGKEIHNYVIKTGLESNVFVGSALIDMYSKCGGLDIGRRVFDGILCKDVVMWNSMIAGYAQNGHCIEALNLFRQIQQAGIKPNSVTLVSILPACACLATLQQGNEIHTYIVKGAFDSEIVVGSALVDMYAKCGTMKIAQLVFDRMPHIDVALCNAMISGYAQNGYSNEAFKLFRKIQQKGMKPDSVTLSSILPACAYFANLQQGKEIHNYILRNGFEADVSIENALIHMYAKCGSIEIANSVFDRMCVNDVVSWNAIIAGYGVHGHGDVAQKLFQQMQNTGIQPDYITFVALLSACSHAGLVDKGWQYFSSMSQEYEIIPRMEHYACMVDLLGRAGLLDEARDFIEKMPLKPGADVWGSLLGACCVHRNAKLAETVAEHLLELKPDNAGYYVLLSNIYATEGRWADVERVRALMRAIGLQKRPGCSWIEVGNSIHEFVVGDKSHPQSEKIYATLASLSGRMKEAGYVPDTTFVLHDAGEVDSK